MLKQLFDFIASLFGLIFLSPLFLLIGVLIRRHSPGPVFYKCVRVGKDGQPFGMYKFRTMNDDANGVNPKVTAQDDPRITPIGRVLRKTKLNEFPQLFNVLKGEMSLVGPRPEDPQFVAHYSPEERQILSVKPGITSLASIAYFNEEEMLTYERAAELYLSQIMPSKLSLDQLYVRHRSFLLDLDILFRTFLALVPLFRRAMPDVEDILLGPLQRLARNHIPWFAIDLLTAFGAVTAAGLIWRVTGPLDLGLGPSLFAAFLLALAFSLVNWATGVQRTAWQYASAAEMIDILFSAAISTALLLLGNLFSSSGMILPWGMLLLASFFAFNGFVIARYRGRLITGTLSRLRQVMLPLSGEGRVNVLIVGGGEAGQQMVWLLKNSPRGQAFNVVGIVDDDLWKHGARIHGVKVMGTLRNIPRLVKQRDVTLLIFAIHHIAPAERESILRDCENSGACVVVMPDMLSVLDGVAGLSGETKTPEGRDGKSKQSLILPPIKIRNGNRRYV